VVVVSVSDFELNISVRAVILMARIGVRAHAVAPADIFHFESNDSGVFAIDFNFLITNIRTLDAGKKAGLECKE
jgi:hypothetical protein